MTGKRIVSVEKVAGFCVQNQPDEETNHGLNFLQIFDSQIFILD